MDGEPRVSKMGGTGMFLRAIKIALTVALLGSIPAPAEAQAQVALLLFDGELDFAHFLDRNESIFGFVDSVNR